MKECKNLLISNGYTVIDPAFNVSARREVKNIGDLIDQFNGKAKRIYGAEFQKMTFTREKQVMSNFVKARKNATGAALSVVRKECAAIIDTIFNNIEEFNFKYVPDMNILGQGKSTSSFLVVVET